jgi:hypothetical protein
MIRFSLRIPFSREHPIWGQQLCNPNTWSFFLISRIARPLTCTPFIWLSLISFSLTQETKPFPSIFGTLTSSLNDPSYYFFLFLLVASVGGFFSENQKYDEMNIANVQTHFYRRAKRFGSFKPVAETPIISPKTRSISIYVRLKFVEVQTC